jgi:hypothetical protein
MNISAPKQSRKKNVLPKSHCTFYVLISRLWRVIRGRKALIQAGGSCRGRFVEGWLRVIDCCYQVEEFRVAAVVGG